MSRMLTRSICLALAILACSAQQSDAQLGILLKKAVKASKKLLSKPAKQANPSGAASKGKNLATKPVGKTSADSGVKAINQVTKNLGSSGGAVAKAMDAASIDKLAEISGNLGKSPHKEVWLDLLKRYPGTCLNFLWEHKASIAVATGAGFLFLHPQEFLDTTENVIASTIESTTKNIGKPMVEESVDKLASPIAKELGFGTEAGVSWKAIGTGCAILSLTVFGMWYFRRP